MPRQQTQRARASATNLALARRRFAKSLINHDIAALSNFYIVPLFSMTSQLRFVQKIVIGSFQIT
ncbi:MAG: hypothetical protein ABSG54_14705, partial [Terriglobia bacterium]